MKIKRRLIRSWHWADPDLKGSLAERMLEAEFRNVRDYDAPRECPAGKTYQGGIANDMYTGREDI